MNSIRISVLCIRLSVTHPVRMCPREDHIELHTPHILSLLNMVRIKECG